MHSLPKQKMCPHLALVSLALTRTTYDVCLWHPATYFAGRLGFSSFPL